MKNAFVLVSFLLLQLFSVLASGQSFTNDSIATTMLRKIFTDRQRVQQTVDLSEIEAAIAATNAPEFAIAKILGQQIMNIFDKKPFFQGLNPDDYGPHTEILYNQSKICKSSNYPSLALTTFLVLEFAYEYGHEKEKVLAICDEAVNYYQSLPKKVQKKVVTASHFMASFSISALQQKTQYYDYEGIQRWMDLALFWGRNLYETSTEENKKNTVAAYAQSLSMVGSYFVATNKKDSAIYYWDIAIVEAEKREHHIMLMALYDKKCQFYFSQEAYKEALEVHFKALELATKNKNVTGEVISLQGIAVCYKFLQKPEKAKPFYKKLIGKLAQKDEIQVGILPLVYIGAVFYYEEQKMMDSVIYYQQKRKEIYTFLGENDNLFSTNVELALTYLEMGDTLSSNRTFEDITKLAIPPLNDRNLVLKLNGIANYFNRIGNNQSMVFYAKQAFIKAQNLGLIQERMDAADYLVKGYLYLENQDSVSKYLEEYKVAQKDFYQLTQDSALLDLQTKYETKEKEQEIEALNAQNLLERQNKNLVIGLMLIVCVIAFGIVVLYFKQKAVSEELKNLQHTKDQLFSIIAHDLRSPFNALMGFSKALQENEVLKKSSELTTSINAIHESSRNAYFLFEDLLAWTKAQTGNLTYHPESLYLKQTIHESISILQGMLHFKQIGLTVNLEAEWVQADTYMVQTVLRNLVTNAVKFLNYNGHINISSRVEGEWVRIVVQDNGNGMDKETLSNLFANEENKKGLGLMLCKNFVQKHGGKIGAESSSESGTSIWFTLPKGIAKEIPVPTQNTLVLPSNNKLALSPAAQEYLKPVAEKLKNLSVYYSTDLKHLVKELRLHNEPSLNEWLTVLDKAIDDSDADLYQQLLKDIL